MTDKQLIKFATDFRKGILGRKPSFMMCYAVCAPLATLLGISGVQANLIEGEWNEIGHYWLSLADGRVLDPTIDQFNADFGFTFPPVYLGKPTEVHNPMTTLERMDE